MRKINNIVIHCTATSQKSTVSSICRYWNEQLGWRSPGYHFLIEANGKIHNLQSIDKASNGVKGHNADSIHISYIGGIDDKCNAIDNRTTEQIKSMLKIVKEMQRLFPKAEIKGHRDFPNVKKECPCFDVKLWWKGNIGDLDPKTEKRV